MNFSGFYGGNAALPYLKWAVLGTDSLNLTAQTPVKINGWNTNWEIRVANCSKHTHKFRVSHLACPGAPSTSSGSCQTGGGAEFTVAGHLFLKTTSSQDSIWRLCHFSDCILMILSYLLGHPWNQRNTLSAFSFSVHVGVQAQVSRSKIVQSKFTFSRQHSIFFNNFDRFPWRFVPFWERSGRPVVYLAQPPC